MSGLQRAVLLFLLLSCASRLLAVSSHQTATELRDLCKAYITSVDVGTATLLERERTQHQLNVGICLGYVQGAVDGYELELASGLVPKSLKACVPKGATADELIRVFLKFIEGHPEDLSYAAADVVWRAMIVSYPCPSK
jgi:hypothetical protein